MEIEAFPRHYPVPTVTTVLFLAGLVLTATYYAGFVPGIPKTIPMFVALLQATVVLLVIAVVAWAIAYIAK